MPNDNSFYRNDGVNPGTGAYIIGTSIEKNYTMYKEAHKESKVAATHYRTVRGDLVAYKPYDDKQAAKPEGGQMFYPSGHATLEPLAKKVSSSSGQ
jgi:hypothetical protein